MARPIADFRRPEIVEGLRKTLARKGLSIPSNDDIASAAEMSRQLVRHYYTDQKEIVKDLTTKLAAEYQELLTRVISVQSDVCRLTVFLDFYFGMAAKGTPQKPADDHIYDALFALAAADIKLRNQLKQQYNLLASVISHELHLKYPKLDIAHCNELALTIVSMMYGHWKMVGSLRFAKTQNKVMREAVDRLIHSYVADPPHRNDEPAPPA